MAHTPARGWDTVPHTYARTPDDRDLVELEPATPTHEAAHELGCRLIARGTIVALLREPGRLATRIAVVEERDGSGVAVVCNEAFWRLYRGPSAARVAAWARGLLASGNAFNY